MNGAVIAYAVIEVLRMLMGIREDMRRVQSGEPLPELKPIPAVLTEAAVEYAREHGLPNP
jgi:hypothetical protein